MPNDTYYPRTIDGRVPWWQNLRDNAGPILTGLGLPTSEVNPILADAAWAVYSYGTVRHAYDEFIRAIYQYADGIATGTPNGQLPTAPTVPAWPAAPATSIAADFESRRERWVGLVKHLPGYNKTVGASLGLESADSTFNKGTYQCELSAMASLNAHTVGGRFRKAGGQVQGINLYGRRAGTLDWSLLGRYTVTPFTAAVPLAGSAPEQWEFMARAVSKDAEFGLDSTVSVVIVRP